jgi:hypothetical protein
MDRGRRVTGYAGRHRKHADPRDLPAAMRGLANLIVIVPSKGDSSE